MQQPIPQHATRHPIRANARVLTASLVGTAVEFYDFYIYATAAALVFGPLFFPSDSPTAQTLFAFMSFGIAFIARPIAAQMLAAEGRGGQAGLLLSVAGALSLLGIWLARSTTPATASR